MIKEVIALGKDITEAQENARAALGAGPLDDVKFEIIHAGSKGIFGIIGVKKAQVKAYIELPDAPERRQRREKQRREPREDAQITSAENGSMQNEERPAKKNNRRRKNNKNRISKEAITENNSAPKARVIPECELKLEKREVTRGEDRSFDFIMTLISDIGLNASAELFSCDDGTRRITITGADASTLIGHHGDTLDALQYLANLASAQKNENGERDKSRVTIDIEGYRAKREETLRALARRMAAKALRNKRSVMLEPMSAYERRIIHSEIQGIEGVSTNSIGSDNNRKIVIFLTDKKPKELFEEDEARRAKEAAEEAAKEEVISTPNESAEDVSLETPTATEETVE